MPYDISIDGGAPIDNGTSTTYASTGLTPFVEVGYRVRARDNQGNIGEWSATVLATPVPYVLYGGDIVTYEGNPLYYV